MVLLPLLGWMEEIPYSRTSVAPWNPRCGRNVAAALGQMESQIMNYTLLWILKNTTVHLR